MLGHIPLARTCGAAQPLADVGVAIPGIAVWHARLGPVKGLCAQKALGQDGYGSGGMALMVYARHLPDNGTAQISAVRVFYFVKDGQFLQGNRTPLGRRAPAPILPPALPQGRFRAENEAGPHNMGYGGRAGIIAQCPIGFYEVFPPSGAVIHGAGEPVRRLPVHTADAPLGRPGPSEESKGSAVLRTFLLFVEPAAPLLPLH